MRNYDLIKAYMAGDPEAVKWAKEQLKDWQEPPKRFHAPGAGFVGAVLLGDDFTTPFPTIRHYTADYQTRRGLSSTDDQRLLQSQWRKAA